MKYYEVTFRINASEDIRSSVADVVAALAGDAGFEAVAIGEELFLLAEVVGVVLGPHGLRADNRHAAPKDAQELRQQFEPRVLQEIGDEYGVTRERINAIIKNAQGKLLMSSFGPSIREFAEGL